MLRPVEVLTRKLAHPRRETFVQPSLLAPPGIEPARIHAGHAARQSDLTGFHGDDRKKANKVKVG